MSTQPTLSPIEQLMGSQQQAATPSQPQTQTQNDLSPIEQLMQDGQKQQTDSTGQVTNDVGNTVIVPKDGESFSDTVQRAVAQQKGMTPQQRQDAINKETATMPAKAAQTLGAAAGIGVAGPALLAAPGELTELAIKHLAGNVLPGMEEAAARAKLAEIAPKALQIVREWALPASAVGGLLKLLSMGNKH